MAFEELVKPQPPLQIAPTAIVEEAPRLETPPPQQQAEEQGGESSEMKIEQEGHNDEEAYDPQKVVEYQGVILQHMIQGELLRPQPGDCLPASQRVQSLHRSMLYEWLIQLHDKQKLQNKSLHMALNIFDKFQRRRQIAREEIQLYGLTALWIACKYEEIYPPDLGQFVRACADAYTQELFKIAEGEILKVLDFNVLEANQYNYYELFAQMCRFTRLEFNVGLYWLELCIFSEKMQSLRASIRAAVIVNLVLKVYRYESFPAELQIPGWYSESLFYQSTKFFWQLFTTLKPNQPGIKSVYQKFTREKYDGVFEMIGQLKLQEKLYASSQKASVKR